MTSECGCEEETQPSPCSGPRPFQEEPCQEITCPPLTTQENATCAWQGWSEWTQCDSFCNGTQFRRQLCSCPNDTETCSNSYNDSLCMGTPLTETQSCNIIDENGTDICSNTWGFVDNWSLCISDNHYCGDGTQWRRQFCLDGNGNILSDEACVFSGVTPIFETRNCSMNQTCCEFSDYVNITCNQLNTLNSPVCVTPWAERQCNCPESNNNNSSQNESNNNSNSQNESNNSTSQNNSTNQSNDNTYTQCLWTTDMIDNPPISFDLASFCPAGENLQDRTTCDEYSSNNTCLTWTVILSPDSTNFRATDRNETSLGDCNSSVQNCWDGWTDWSPCAGSCDEAYQWRRQTTSKGLSACRVPPSYEFQSCNLSNCCEWVLNDSVSWSNCSGVCGLGVQMRFPYTCSCGDDYQCPPPEFEWETQPCQMETNCSCRFDVQFTEPTLCDNSLGEAWYSQRCICEGASNSSSCDISNCYGAPIVYNLTCGCKNETLIPLSAEAWKTATWPDDSQFNTFTCSNLTWFELINQTSFNSWELLAIEVIAAELNRLSGFNLNAQLNDTIQSASDLLNNCTWTSYQTQEAQNLMAQLHYFNNDGNTYNLNSLNQDTATNNANSAQDGAQNALLFLLFIPAVVLIVGVVVGVVIFLKRRKQNQSSEVSL